MPTTAFVGREVGPQVGGTRSCQRRSSAGHERFGNKKTFVDSGSHYPRR